MGENMEGWYRPSNSRKWHYFKEGVNGITSRRVCLCVVSGPYYGGNLWGMSMVMTTAQITVLVVGDGF